MKSERSETEEICELIKRKHRNESGVIKSIMDFTIANSKMCFGGISQREYMTLEILVEYSEYKNMDMGVNVSTLAQCLKLSMPQVSRLLGVMETKGYIKRSTGDKDRRSTYVTITDKGRLIRKCAFQECREHMERVTSKMGEDKVKQLISLIEEMADIVKGEQKARMKNHKES